jgi:hypothetical protein
MATSGPGAAHLLNGLYDAKIDNQPVFAMVEQQATISLSADSFFIMSAALFKSLLAVLVLSGRQSRVITRPVRMKYTTFIDAFISMGTEIITQSLN